MTSICKPIAWVTLWAFPLLLTLGTLKQVADSSPLDQTLSDFNVENATVEDAVSHLIVANNLAGGVVQASDCGNKQAEEKHSFHLSGLTVRQALDQILATKPNFRWVEENHLIIVVPSTEMPELLRTRVQHFEINNPQYTLSAASGELLQLKEIKDRKAQLGLKQSVQYMIGGSDNREALRSKVSVQNVQMYEVLNTIAATNSPAVWRYTEYHCDNVKEVSIFWVVR
jgi:hypothetical protein